MNDLQFVEAAEAQLPALGEFMREAWGMAGPGTPGWTGADDDVIDEIAGVDALRARIGGPERRMFVALDGDRVVAFAATRWAGEGPAELAGIVVLQEMVGMGIGTPLLELALDRVRHDGAVSVYVRTEADNDRALGFYRSRGFVDEHDVVEEVEGQQVRLTELRRSLDPIGGV